MDLGYDGTDFHGWARQPGLRTVEGTLEEALRTVLRLDEPPQLTVAGRTDAGVHARHQVAHVDVPEPAWAAAGHRLVDRLRGVLPDDVRVATVQVAPLGFDARFSAIWRRYTYRLCDIPGGADPLRRHESVHHRHRLDVDAMNAAGEALLGEHDFLAFCRPREGATTVRELRELTWWREGELVVGRVLADAFCHHMVRALVGALVAVGDGRRPVEWPGAVLAAGARDSAVTVMPAHGLVLEAVGYPRDDLLAARALESRRLRDTGRVARSAADA